MRQAEKDHAVPTWSDPPRPTGVAPVPPEGKTAQSRGRRIGRPRGPARVPLTVRILAAHNERLTAEVAAQGLSPQYLVEQALAEYFARLDDQRSHGEKDA